MTMQTQFQNLIFTSGILTIPMLMIPPACAQAEIGPSQAHNLLALAAEGTKTQLLDSKHYDEILAMLSDTDKKPRFKAGFITPEIAKGTVSSEHIKIHLLPN